MKKFFAIMLTLAAMASAPVASANPDITDLLKGALGGAQSGSGNSDNGTSTALSGLQGLVEGLIAESNLSRRGGRLGRDCRQTCSLLRKDRHK